MPWVLSCLLLLTSLCWSEEVQWTHWAEEGEDASSSHHYFFLIEGKTVKRIRWVWNGGAQNPPEVIDYLLSEGRLQVFSYTGKREHVGQLIQGRSTDLKLIETRAWFRKKDGSLKPAMKLMAGAIAAEDAKMDAANLATFLSAERKPIKRAESVVIETKFVEVSPANKEELGFDWTLEPPPADKGGQDPNKNEGK